MSVEGADTEGTAYLYRRDAYDVTHYNYEAALSRMAQRAEQMTVMQGWEQECDMHLGRAEHEKRLQRHIEKYEGRSKIHPAKMSEKVVRAMIEREKKL